MIDARPTMLKAAFGAVSVLTVTILLLNSYSVSYSENFIAEFIEPLKIKILKYDEIKPVATVKKGRKWIVLTSVSWPTEDVKRLASFADWNLVVVADTKTPLDWQLDGVHFLSVAFQKQLPFFDTTTFTLPYQSYTRKNVGYLYAISQGAEWIYDTDDDNKPYGLGLDQFDYNDDVSGIRYRPTYFSDNEIRQRLFNPYRFFGRSEMWPRGFPLEHLEKHTNGKDTQVLCQKMKRAAVQQGLVHHDPDVDAIYRLMHADSKSGLNVTFNQFTPPITLSVGTYAPWNSQNTLFHKSAFHTLFLPTTVSFRTTDIWRSYIAQKILHLSGLTVSFVPTNAVQFRNAHDYLKDLNSEQQVYDDSGKLVQFLHNWTCSVASVKDCVKLLATDLVRNSLWGQRDANLTIAFMETLETMRFQFPPLVEKQVADPYGPTNDETTRLVNCRRMNLEFELVGEKDQTPQSVRKAEQKLNYFGDIADWCNETGYSELLKSFPTPKQLAEQHDNNYVLQNNAKSVLVVVNNYPWTYAMGLIQRLYEPYFASVIFCGTWHEYKFEKVDNYTQPLDPINYVHMNPAEMHRGFFAYHCITLAQQMRFSSNVNGYFLLADDSIFNIWQQIDYSRVHHVMGVTYSNCSDWWPGDNGILAARRAVQTAKDTVDPKVIETWQTFENGLRKYGYLLPNETVDSQMLSGLGRSVSDFFYIPSTKIDYYASLMTIFYKAGLFLELAVNRFLRSVNHQTSPNGNYSYLWLNRRNWSTLYSENLMMLHPIKPSQFRAPVYERFLYCEKVMQVWSDIMFRGSTNYTTKQDGDEDYLNG